MKSFIKSIQYYTPSRSLTNFDLSDSILNLDAEKIFLKTGILNRYIASDSECVSDMAVSVCEKLFDTGICLKTDIDYLILCTQSPDYFLPTTACLVQDRLGLPTSCGSLDFNLGCSGFVYGLGLAKGLIESGQAKNIILVTADTYSKFIDNSDYTTKTIFGDAATATLVSSVNGKHDLIGPFVYGTDGSGANHLIVSQGGMKNPSQRPGDVLIAMNGPEIFDFTLRVIPKVLDELLDKCGLSVHEVDLFVFHQANKFMLDALRKKCKLPVDKFPIAMSDVGNTVSSTIPIVLSDMICSGIIGSGDKKIILVGFGVGLSWSSALICM